MLFSSRLAAWAAVALLIALVHPVTRAADIVIAHIGPFSGPLAGNGEANHAGAKAYFDVVNAQGGIHGNKIRLVREDDRYKAEETDRLLKMVAARDKPSAFINILGSANVTEVLKNRTADQLQIPIIGVTPGSEALRNPGSPYLFHLQAGDRAQINAVLGHLATVGITRIAVVYQDIPFGRTGMALADQLAPIKGLTIVGSAPMASGSSDGKTAATAMRKFNAQAYLMITTNNSGAAFVRDARGSGDQTPIYGLSYVTVQSVVEEVGVAKATGIGLAQITPNPQSMKSALVRDYQAAMKSYAPNVDLSSMSLVGYIAARVTVEALRRAKDSSPATLDAALRRLKTDLGGYPVDLTNGDNIGSSMVEIGVINRSGALQF